MRSLFREAVLADVKDLSGSGEEAVKEGSREIHIVRAEKGEGRAITEFVKSVKATMGDESDWLFLNNSEDEMRRIDNGTDIAYKAVCADTGDTAGVLIVEIPSRFGGENLGTYIGLSEEELKKVAHMDTAAVAPAYRGLKLQRRLMERAEEELYAEGFRYFMCTVHPENIYSRGNITGLGYRPVWKGEKYGGTLREVMLKERA